MRVDVVGCDGARHVAAPESAAVERRSPAVHGKQRCRMHGGAHESGAPRGNRNALKHGLFTGDAIGERKRIQALLADARKLLREMK
jgi:hypothetical protein